MSLRISFYLDGDDTAITSFNGLTSNPFRQGDLVHLSVAELTPKELNKYSGETQQKFIDENEKLKQFNLKDVVLVREKKYVSFNLLKEPTVLIEYHCELSE